MAIEEIDGRLVDTPENPSETDRRAAAELGIPVEELVRIMDVWMKHAAIVAKERRDRLNQLASNRRTMVD
jgi:hypothetical protein